MSGVGYSLKKLHKTNDLRMFPIYQLYVNLLKTSIHRSCFWLLPMHYREVIRRLLIFSTYESILRREHLIGLLLVISLSIILAAIFLEFPYKMQTTCFQLPSVTRSY